ncbi:MAG: Crp/Fnr family transcriptional regulator [Alphaproteobacteria bacterium]|nr:Crp/Fnr family transcriptional regulator [Alphaproteobacteria bacterium]MDX5415436.1 Crp/Fnr family transcriptional regulator [Alphaproteobacteria bacterium]MDX5492664.1 Crp/Fnr family transcriptional regulator [Alphaproteobacteria bacterium]
MSERLGRQDDDRSASNGGASNMPEGCANCPFSNGGMCGAVMAARSERRRRKTEGTVRARQHVLRAGEDSGRVIVLRDGWAARFTHVPDGRRQVLSILLPGDVAGAELVVRTSIRVPVQALTDISYCAFDVQELKEMGSEDPGLLWSFLDICTSGRRESEARIVDLGRRNAEQRLARLIAELHRRLRSRGLAGETSMPFPLRQQMIADALGLTQVHVSRVMSSFRENNIIKVNGGSLRILDMEALLDIAEIYRR